MVVAILEDVPVLLLLLDVAAALAGYGHWFVLVDIAVAFDDPSILWETVDMVAMVGLIVVVGLADMMVTVVVEVRVLVDVMVGLIEPSVRGML